MAKSPCYNKINKGENAKKLEVIQVKEVFLKAHQMTREIKRQYQEVDYRAQFGLCLSYLLKNRKEEKGMEYPELTGTPKQVAWANDIREKMVEGMKQALEHRIYMLRKYHSEQISEEKIEKFKEECLELLKYMVETKTSAKWYIEHRSAAHDIIFKNLNRERKGMELIKI